MALVMRVRDNDADYRLGDEHKLTGWVSYQFDTRLSGSVRLEGYDRGNLDGRDLAIVAPVQTADPNRQGGQRWDLGLGPNLKLGGHRLALEASRPIHQRLDGPQLK